MYWMHKFTKQQEQTEKGREPFPSAITALLPELVFVMSYSEPSDDQGNWSGRTKMLNSIQEVIAELNAAAASCDLIIHSFYLITPFAVIRVHQTRWSNYTGLLRRRGMLRGFLASVSGVKSMMILSTISYPLQHPIRSNSQSCFSSTQWMPARF